MKRFIPAGAMFAISLLGAFGATIARADEPFYLYGGPSGAFTPEHSIPTEYYTDQQNGAPLVVKIYRMPLERAALLGGIRAWQLGSTLDTKGLILVRTLTSTQRDNQNPGLRPISLPALPAGYYAAAASAGSAASASMFDVTTLGIVENQLRDGRSFFAVDLRTFRRHLGPTRIQIRDSGVARDIRCDSTGLAQDAGALWSDNAVAIATTADGSAMVLALTRDYVSASDDVGFVQTDRPVYRPGQTIDLRAIVRAGGIGSYAIPAGSRKVTLLAPDGSVVYQHAVALSPFGTVNAEVRLPDDAQLGTYSIQVGKLRSSVLVSAYKKPEYELAFAADRPYVIGGDRATFRLSAQYFFGRPAAGLHLHYIAYKQPQYVYWDTPYRFAEQYFPIRPVSGRTKLAEGDVNTDAAGRSSFAFTTARTNYQQVIQIEANGRDASGRTVTTSTSLDVVPASFSLALVPAQWFAQEGQRNDIAISAQGYDGKPRANAVVNVEIVGRRWDSKSSRELEISRENRSLVTDASGKATLAWTPHSGGSYSFTAKSSDERGYAVNGFTYLWVIGAGEEAWFAPIEQPVIIAQKGVYAPNERPRVLVTLPKLGRDALVLVATDRLVSTRVVHVTGQTVALNLDAPRDASQFTVTVELPNENGVSSANATIRVAPAPKSLSVTIAAHKARYTPGERAEFDVRVRDAAGNPVRTELGIGVVDEAIYAVQQASSATPLDAFYGQIRYPYPSYSWFRPNRAPVATIGRATSSMAYDTYAVTAAAKAAPPPPPGGPTIRSQFADTAYWSPSVVTNDDGNATLAFIWPDNLTTWRATGVAVSRSTDVGQTTSKTLVTKDFLVRLETPRFLRTGDHSQIVGIAHGLSSNPRVVMRLDAGQLATGAQTADLTLDAYQSASTSWPVLVPGVGNATLTLSGHDGALSDAMRLPLPLLADTAAEHVRDAGRLPDNAALAVSIPIGYTPGDVHLSLSPSIVAELVQNLRLLDVYPYYCTEQTMSAALPAIFIDRVLKRAHLSQPSDISTGQIVRNAIARLQQLQHSDGSWGWWENDSGHPFMTAYALYGLAEFRKGGFPVPSGMFDSGVDSLVAQLAGSNRDTLRFWGGAQPGSEWNTRAFMLFALADAAPSRVDRTLLEQTRAHAGSLNPYALAVLGLAEHQLGSDGAARDLLARLDAQAINDGAFTYWRGETWHYAWEDDPIETTAYALRLEAAMNPQSPRVTRVINFLRAQRRGDWWYTTKDTAAAIYALTEASAPDQSEFNPDETIRVTVDGRVVRTVHIAQPILDAADASVIVPAAMLHDGSTIGFERSGRGALYWSSDAVRYVPPTATQASDAGESLLARLFARAPEFAITRSYHIGHAGPWQVGDEITVDVTVISRSDVQYVLVEDPFPAGVEHVSEQGHAENDAWSGLQLLDDRAAFFATKLYAGEPLRLEYTLRVTTPGTYTAPPPTAGAMYGPPVSAVGRPTTVMVE